MKLATLQNGKPDGELVVVSRDLTKMARVADIAPTLQARSMTGRISDRG